ncbi:MAG TPA: hypothetical protein VJ303_13925 [Steroidobacteraceae bacterium]|nr:hypothetical protein [Steroidobacteraceae bacterium]
MTAWRVVRYWLYIGHRWLGIGVCLLFVLWFVFGLVMSYVGYPEAQPARRYQALQPLDWSQVRLDPSGLLTYLGLQVGMRAACRPITAGRAGITGPGCWAACSCLQRLAFG